MMIGGSDSITQPGSGTQGMDSSFRRNTLLANTTLILLCDFGGIFVASCGSIKLLRSQTYRHRIPELTLCLSLPLSETHKRTAPKNKFGEIERNVKSLSQRSERVPCTRSSLNSRELGQECEHSLLVC